MAYGTDKEKLEKSTISQNIKEVIILSKESVAKVAVKLPLKSKPVGDTNHPMNQVTSRATCKLLRS